MALESTSSWFFGRCRQLMRRVFFRSLVCPSRASRPITECAKYVWLHSYTRRVPKLSRGKSMIVQMIVVSVGLQNGQPRLQRRDLRGASQQIRQGGPFGVGELEGQP